MSDAPGASARVARDTLRLALLQTAPRLRDREHNARRIAELAGGVAADVALTPELSLTGYDIGDAVHRLALACDPGEPLPFPALAMPSPAVVCGCIDAGTGGPYNAAVVLRDGRVEFRHRKLYLPTYGMFDEARWFGRGESLEVWEPAAGWRAGVLICEDFWHPALAWLLAARGIDLLLVQAAAPGRGVWQGGEHGAFASADAWERIARTTAQLYGIYVGLCNRTGVEGGVTFEGGSLIVGPDGSVIVRAADTGEGVITAELRRAEVRRARSPGSHIRDDDPSLVAREIARMGGR